MKIGILTFHRAYNYGAILQAFALQEKLRGMNVQSEIIDYLSVEKRAQNRLFVWNKKLGTKGNLVKILKDCYRKRKNASFDKFMDDEMEISPTSYSTFDELVQMDQKKTFDAYIVGSDQVWNFNNTLSDPAFLLSFVSDDNKKCSYAASIGSAKFDKDMYDRYAEELKKFRVLTVREEGAIETYGFLKENQARAVVDPTLLLRKEDYQKIASPRILKKKYAFMYTIGEERNLRKYARNYCRNNNLIFVDSKKSSTFFQHTSPRDFLSFILYAECVFTNSFHGTALSIMLEKEFVTEIHTRKSVNNRFGDLMRKLELQDRDIDATEFNSKRAIDYKRVNKLLEEQRKKSENILQEIIEDEGKQ